MSDRYRFPFYGQCVSSPPANGFFTFEAQSTFPVSSSSVLDNFIDPTPYRITQTYILQS